jgi:MoxR-like ATPase
MNPFDAVGTARISAAVYDRTCRLAMDYQGVDDELVIVLRETGEAHVGFVTSVVELVRLTRVHTDIRIGSSVRGAIDMVKVSQSLAELRGRPTVDLEVGLDAALVALTGRIRVREGANRTPESIVEELWRKVFGPAPEPGAPGKVPAPTGAAAD